jgi:excisionase family DNA binding protein
MTAPTLTPLNLRREQIAQVLNVCLRVVDDLIANEAFPSFKIGGTRLARYEDVKAYNDSRVSAASQSA